ncbi:hypothetical protein V8C86DRAFT_908870 [Haematococcus lacustris]
MPAAAVCCLPAGHRLVGAALQGHCKRLQRLAAANSPAASPAPEQATPAPQLQSGEDEALAAHRDKVRRVTAGWVRQTAGAEEAGVLRHWLPLLSDLLRDTGQEGALPATSAQVAGQPEPRAAAAAVAAQPDSPGRLASCNGHGCTESSRRGAGCTGSDVRHNVRLALEGLRELAALMPPLQVLVAEELVEVFTLAASHPHPAIAGLARQALGHIRSTVLARVVALTSPQLLSHMQVT